MPRFLKCVRAFFVLFVLFLAACSGGEDDLRVLEPDVGDAGVDVADTGDAGEDVEPPPQICDGCQTDGDCPEDGLCLTIEDTGESFCGTPCEVDADDCPHGSTCYAIDGASPQCVPDAGTCERWPPSSLGAPCVGNEEVCSVEATECVTAGDESYCSVKCETDADCPTNYARCAGGVCRADWELTPAGCGRHEDGPLAPCGDGCANGSTCATDLVDELPETVAPFCTRQCDDDSDCPEGAHCGHTAGGSSICLDDSCRCLERPEDGSLFDDALAEVGLNRCTAMFDRAVWDVFPPSITADPFRLSFFNPLLGYPAGGLAFADRLQSDVGDRGSSQTPVADSIEEAADRLDASAPQNRVFPLPGEEAPLVEAIGAVYDAADSPDSFDVDAVEQAIEDVPQSLRQKTATVLLAMVEFAIVRDQILDDAGVDDELATTLFDYMPATIATRPDFQSIDWTNDQIRGLMAGELDLGDLFTAARDLAAAVETRNFDDEEGATGFSVDLETPLGRIVIDDAESGEVTADGPFLLVISTGGDDTYRGSVAATSEPANPVSVVVDVAGDDTYAYTPSEEEPPVEGLPRADETGRYDGEHFQIGDQFGPISRSMTPRQGAGILGAGLLFDLGGDDDYRSLKLSQGTGVFGVGALYDGGGLEGDVYACEQACQGAGSFGIGLLVDRSGDDRFTVVQNAQGFGYVRGYGLLFSQSGDDRYRAVLGDPELGGGFLYPSAQNSGGSNTSFSQGAGFGRRAGNDGHYASGGIGVFHDAAGDDEYTVDIFGQGTGYWYGTGLFYDAGGNDRYNGRWYNQGSSAHFGVGIFQSADGHDQYNRDVPILATAVGQGHDLSLGIADDGGGDDEIIAPGLGLGAGNEGGVGFFFQRGGDDVYDAPDSRTFGGSNLGGKADWPPAAHFNLGVFVDTGGTDDYVEFDGESAVGEDRVWTWSERRDDPSSGELGVGVDGTGEVGLP